MSDYAAPGKPTTVAIRPLDKGIIQNVSPMLTPKGSFFSIKEFIPDVEGLRRRGGIIKTLEEAHIEDGPIREFFTFWNSAGTQQGLAIGKKFLWKVELDGVTRIPCTYAEGGTDKVAFSDGVVTFSNGSGGAPAVLDLDSISKGDIIYVAGAEHTLLTYEAVSGTGTVTSSDTVSATSTYFVYRGFASSDDYDIDWALGTDTLVIVDGYHIPFIYDGTDLDLFTMDNEFIAGSVCFAFNRFWFGNIVIAGAYGRQQIRWTDVIVVADWENISVTSYVSLPYTNSVILKMTLIGEMMLVFFNNLMFYGTQSSDPLLPVIFRRIDTADVGLMGKRAIASAEDAVFFVGPDNIWARDVNTLGTIGDSILPIVRRYKENLKGAIMTVDPKNSILLIGVPSATDTTLELVLVYNLNTKAWSIFDLQFESMQTVGLSNQNSMDELGSKYAVGTVSGSSGSAALTGSGTLWAANVAVGDSFEYNANAGEINYAGVTYTVLVVNSNTSITLSTNLSEALSGVAYTLATPINALVGSTDDYATDGETMKGVYFWRNSGVEGTSDLYRMYDSVEEDNNDVVRASFETGDMDLDYPDTSKTITSLRLKLREYTNEALLFRVSFSENGGRTFNWMGNMSIPENRNEGKLDFIASGSTIRLKVEEENGTDPYTIVEMDLYVKPRGREERFF